MAPPRTMHWFRWYHNGANDSKLRRIGAYGNTSVANVLAVWIMVLESASENADRGVIGSWNNEDVAFTLGISEETVAKILEGMQGKLLTGQQVTNWHKRQPKREKTDGSISEHIGTHQDISDIKEHMGPRGEERRREEKKQIPADGGSEKKSPRTKKPKPLKYANYPTNVCELLFETYRKHRGPIEYPTFRHQTHILFPTNYTTEQLTGAIVAWSEWVETLPADKAKWEHATTWAKEIDRWTRLGEMPLVTLEGVTERGRLAAGAA